LAVLLALWFQYQVGPSIVSQKGWVWKGYRAIPGMGKMTYHAWHDSCAQYKDHHEWMAQCAGIAGVMRPTFLATLFFTVSAVATKFVPTLNREAWPAKYGLFFFGVAFLMFVPNFPLFTGIYLWIARLGAAVFVIMQQIILIDVAYNWNDDWVERAVECDRMEYGSGGAWLKAILATCLALYVAAITIISFLYKYFDECPENTWVITLSLLAILAITVIQLSGEEGSLLTSAVISVYVAYLAFSVVSKNPNGSCNPRLGHNDVWGICIGMTLTAVSLVWTGWSWTAEDRLNLSGVQSTKSMGTTPNNSANNRDSLNLDVPFLDPEDQPTSGIVMDADVMQATATRPMGVDVWKLNVVMALISCWVAMTLTGWGTMEVLDIHENAANPTVGRVNMAMLGVSQWIAILLYVWTLVAPRVFPDRDFS
jgi:hypothetical protein